MTFVSLEVELILFKVQGDLEGQQNTNRKRHVCYMCTFLLHTLVTSLPEHALNTPKTLYKHASTPGPRFGYVPDTLEMFLDYWLCTSVCRSLRYSYPKITPISRFEHVQHQFDNIHVRPRFLTSPSVLGLCHFCSRRPVHVCLICQCV